MVTQEQAEKYYKKKGEAHQVIKKNIKKQGHIVYGERALNTHLPSHLDRHTEDWDVFTKTPKKTARRVERKLDKKYGGDYFYVEPARHKGTYKVKSRVTRMGVADYTKLENKVPHKTIKGVKYVKLRWVKQHIKKTLKDPKAYYRHDKDKEALQRIKIYETLKKKKAKTKAKIKKVGAWSYKPIIPKLKF